MKNTICNGKRRIQELDKLIERIYEDNVLGKISDERFARMSANYEAEQKSLIAIVDASEIRLREMEKETVNLRLLLNTLRECTDLKELTPTVVNTLIKRIEVHNNDKSSGHCFVKVDIYFTAVGLVDVPTEEEIRRMIREIQENPGAYRFSA